MKAALATAERLLGSIEELVARERIWLQTGHCAQAAAVSLRAAPLFARLLQLGATDGALRAMIASRVASLVARRRENHGALASRRAFVSAESRRIAEARRRLTELAPVYGRIRPAGAKRSRLNAAV